MTLITTIQATDNGTTSLNEINTNFSNLNTGKMETSVLSTDGTFAANSDALAPSQKAAKTYISSYYPVFNVKSYGALGNGSTDDSAAIQSAITAAISAGGEVVFPSGTYIIGTTLTLGNNVKLKGLAGYGMALSAGTASVILKAKTNLNSSIVNLGNYIGMEFEDIEFDGNGSNQSSSAYIIDGSHLDGIYASHKFTRCTFANSKAGNFAVFYASVGGAGHVSAFIKFIDCVWRGCVDGAFNATNFVWAEFYRCHIFGCTRPTGVFTLDNASCVIDGCDFESNSGTIVTCIAGSDVNSNVMIRNSDFETVNADIAIYCQDYTLHPLITGNQILTHSGTGIIVNNCQLFNISNNTIQSSTAGGTGIEIDPTSLNFNINGNVISASHTYEILISSGASDYFVVANNSLGGGSVTVNASGSHKVVTNNV